MTVSCSLVEADDRSCMIFSSSSVMDEYVWTEAMSIASFFSSVLYYERHRMLERYLPSKIKAQKPEMT